MGTLFFQFRYLKGQERDERNRQFVITWKKAGHHGQNIQITVQA